MGVQVFRQSIFNIPLNQIPLLLVRNRRVPVVEVEDFFQLFLPVIGYPVVASLDSATVFRGDRGKASESIKTNDFSIIIIGLVNAPKRRKQRKILAPPYSELHDNDMHGKNHP